MTPLAFLGTGLLGGAFAEAVARVHAVLRDDDVVEDVLGQARAALDAKADAAIVRRLAASADHPVALAFSEGESLKRRLLRKR